jgi:hypothetical protein
VTTGTVEEKILQRQLSKEGLQSIVSASSDRRAEQSRFASAELRDLFSLRLSRPGEPLHSDTYDLICGGRQRRRASTEEGEGDEEEDEEEDEGDGEEEAMACRPQIGQPEERELECYSHHFRCDSLDDEVLRRCGGGDVSFVFGCLQRGKESAEFSQSQSQSQSFSQSQSLSLSQPSHRRANGLCLECGSYGHWARDCRARMSAGRRRLLESNLFDGVVVMLLTGMLGLGPQPTRRSHHGGGGFPGVQTGQRAEVLAELLEAGSGYVMERLQPGR